MAITSNPPKEKKQNKTTNLPQGVRLLLETAKGGIEVFPPLLVNVLVGCVRVAAQVNTVTGKAGVDTLDQSLRQVVQALVDLETRGETPRGLKRQRIEQELLEIGKVKGFRGEEIVPFAPNKTKKKNKDNEPGRP